MIFRQLYDLTSGTYTYLLASDRAKEAVLIDPVADNLEQYLALIDQLGLRLVRAFDTHTHADHVTALGALRDRTGCITTMGEFSQADCVSEKIKDGEVIDVDGLRIKGLYTPGHTNESFSYYVEDKVFTGDVLLIRGSGRTDFQSGDPGRSWDSIQRILFALPDTTWVYPGHDYKGWTVSTIAEEKAHNPRLAGKTREQYLEIMNNLNLPDPKMMDIAVPANLRCGRSNP